MIYPNGIEKNEIIGITATSMGITNEFDKNRLKSAQNNLLKLGYKTILTDNVFKYHKMASSSGDVRAREFMNLLKDKNIKVISELRGGDLILEMLPYLNDFIIKNNPKWIFGYSDSSLLNFYITTKFDIATINSSNILDFSSDDIHDSVLKIINCFNDSKIIYHSYKLFDDDKNHVHNLNKKVMYKSLYKQNEIVIKGRVIGGCIEAITNILGTKYDKMYDFTLKYSEGILWYLDIFDLDPLLLYQKLLQMKWSGWFNNINGMIIGRTRSVKKIKDFNYLDSLHRVFDDLNIPVIYDADIGHVFPQFSIINGSIGTFTYKNHKGNLILEKK